MVIILGILLVGLVSALSGNLNIIYPQNQNYGENITHLDWNFDGSLNTTTDMCWYQLESGDWQNFNCSENVTGINSIEDGNNWKLKINDSTTQIEETITFWVDSIFPVIIIQSPTNEDVYYQNTPYFTITALLEEDNPYFYLIGKTMKFYVWDTLGGLHYDEPEMGSNNRSSVSYSDTDFEKEGNYDYNITTIDTPANHIGYNSGTIIIDQTNPSLIINSPENTTYPYQITEVEFTVDDINLDDCEVNGTSFACSNRLNTYLENSSEGSNTWTVNVHDLAGNSNTSSVTFFVDSIAPNVEIIYPNQGVLYSNNVTELNFTASDSGIGLDTCWFDNGITNVTIPSCLSGLNNIITNSIEGTNTWTVYANDIFGNENSSTVIFTVDTTPPEITITSPENESLHRGEVFIESSASDTSGIKNMTILINNSNVKECDLDICDYNWNSTSGDDGFYEIRIIAYDNAGKSKEVSIEIEVDNTPPVITLNGDSVVVLERGIYNYTEEGANSTEGTVQIDNSSLNIDEVGIYYIYYSATDLAGNTAVINRTVNVTDTIAPEITIFSPESKTYTINTIKLNVSSDEEINTWWYVLNNGNETIFLPNDDLIQGNGNYNITIYANDSSGNENSSTISFTVDVPSKTSSSSSGSCKTIWNCTLWSEWSECVNGMQSRTCLEKERANCGKGIKLNILEQGESRACVIPITPLNIEEPEILTDTGENDQSLEEIDDVSRGITGSVIGFAKSGTGILTFTVIGILLASWAILYFRRKGLR